MKRLLTGIMLSFSLFLSGCGNEYLEDLDDIQALVDSAYARVNQFGVNLSILAIKDITDSITTEDYWVPTDKIIPVDRGSGITTHKREFTKNDIKFTYTNLNTSPYRYAIYQIVSLEKYYVIYNEPLAVEGIYSVVLKSKERFDRQDEAIAYANANPIPKLIFESTTTATTVQEHIKAVSENFEIIEIFSPSQYSNSAERIRKVYLSLIINDLIP